VTAADVGTPPAPATALAITSQPAVLPGAVDASGAAVTPSVTVVTGGGATPTTTDASVLTGSTPLILVAVLAVLMLSMQQGKRRR
jgi:hypothetical protein